jgi:hypothetical protein
MFMKLIKKKIAVVVFLLSLLSNALLAQKNNCVYKDPVFFLDFGTIANDGVPLMYNIENYKKTTGSCPNDGFYSFASSINNCFAGKWLNLPEDHTAGDDNGKMMIVNAAEKPGDFFIITITGLKPGATYRFSGWFVNVCKYASGCTAIPPVIEIAVYASNIILSSFKTGEIKAANIQEWENFTGEFVMAANTDIISMLMKDLTPGGCGNVFAIDDIEINQCSLPIPAPAATKTIDQIFNIPLPAVIEKRANPIIKQITTEETELNIELYDNGEIDGDTVSIYHNNKLVVNHAGISTKPVSLKLKVNKEHPHHELLMVADNLGRISPNTSLMIITTGKKRYEIFISSSEQKNAKILIDLQ